MHLEFQLKDPGIHAGLAACPQVAALLSQRGLQAEPLFRRPKTAEMATYYVVPLPADAMAAVVRDEALATGELKGAYVVSDSRSAARAVRSHAS